MTLIDIKQHMMKVKMTSLASLCSVFNADPDCLRCMLRHWIAKGKVRQCTRKPACATKCFKCPTANIEIYEWVDALT